MAKKFVVLFNIWHTKDKKYYDVGERVSLDHLTPDQQKTLCDMNGLIPEADFDLPKLPGVTDEQVKSLVRAQVFTLAGLAKSDVTSVPGVGDAELQAWKDFAVQATTPVKAGKSVKVEA